MNQSSNNSLFVADLHPSVTEIQLYDHFSLIGQVNSVRVCINSQTQESLCYGYVNFNNMDDAEKALSEENGSKILDKAIRVARVQRDPTARRNAKTNIIIKKLSPDVDLRTLKELFGSYGKITSMRLPQGENGKSFGYAYIQYETEPSALKAVEEGNLIEIADQAIFVERYQPAHKNESNTNFTNLFIKKLNETVTEEQLTQYFKQFGEPTSVKIRRNETGESLRFGYVAFSSHEMALKAIEYFEVDSSGDLAMESCILSVTRFESRKERMKKREFAWRERQAQYAKFPNLYVKNFDENVTSEQLEAIFSSNGIIQNCVVMKDSQGISKCFGFVSFKDHECAQKAVVSLSGCTLLGPRPLYVTFALKRDARRQQFREMNKKQAFQRGVPVQGAMPVNFNMQNNMMNRLPGGPHGNMPPFQQMQPGMPQRQMPPQGRYSNVPPPPAQNFQQMPSNLVMPQQGQPPMMRMPQHPNYGPRSVPQGIPQQQVPSQMLQPNPQQRAMRTLPKPGLATNTMGQMQQPIPEQSSILAKLQTMNPEFHKQFLGTHLYDIISKTVPTFAAKITGMLLEMPLVEVAKLLDQPQLLQARIEEAMNIIRTHESTN